ncbi:MotA/TolQ/ExbB proton channel family protein [Novosphingobium sp. FKTRR1]|uniref:MotA/TolQ/ExbB proton channel family protein n=1 Tax=Novosphingobium sp. FKTRR1 TaxID=2879118 RepID=UPI001CF0669A|nr:MotA/TolQ/ExbB proton channel family protein [Novosphingobium sp. FKTRR1]
MDFAHLINPAAAAIVGGGTLLATVLRCGLADSGETLRAVHALIRRPFPAVMVRSEVAALIAQLRQDGLFRARKRPTGDPEFDEMIDALIAARSASVLMVRHAAHRKRRHVRAVRAARTLMTGADLAPVFGLAGTLISLSQLQAQGLARSQFMGAISLAVVTTLYGLLLANLLLAPLARAVERRHDRDEAARQSIVDWLAAQASMVAPQLSLQRPHSDPHPRDPHPRDPHPRDPHPRDPNPREAA